MINGYDIAYGLGVGVTAPYWLVKPSARRKVLGAFGNRMGEGLPQRDPARPAILIHAVSLGEMNATRSLVRMLQQLRPQLQFIVSTTTDTGFARAQELYGNMPEVILIRYPLDFSNAVARVLDALRPDVVALMELELWPNFIAACRHRAIPVVLINGRLTASSFRNYSMIKPVAAGMLRSLAKVCVQDRTYADRFLELGAPPENVVVTGTMKFDTAQVTDRVPGDEDLAAAVGLFPGAEPIWVAGSTGPGEEEIVLRVYRDLLGRGFSRLRLAIVPRHPTRFDEVAQVIQEMKFQVVRRSNPANRPENWVIPPVILGDTMGELRKFYSLSSIVFVGRTLVDLGPRQHGSDMIEPAALARPVVVGPYTSNFAEVMNRFRAADAVLQVPDGAALGQTLSVLLSTPLEAAAMARRAQETVRRNQGATIEHVRVILDQLQFRARVQAGAS
ncbi:MAG: 3-deoxy-D-manno-octulosonic acid transferase [Tepidisphaeraceae bacterium]